MLYDRACYKAVVGEKKEALQLLRRSIDLGYAGAYVLRDPDLDSLRGDPEFEAMIAEVIQRVSLD